MTQVHLVEFKSPIHYLVYKLCFAVSQPLLAHGVFGLLGRLLYRCDQLLVLFVLLGVLVYDFGHDSYLLLFPNVLQNCKSVLLQLNMSFKGVFDSVHYTHQT